MKLTIRLASGASIEFEGDAEDFGRFTGLLDQLPDLADKLTSGVADTTQLSPPPPLPPAGSNGGGDGEPEGEANASLDARAIRDRLTRVGATNHVERVTVMAQAAVEAGQGGVTFEQADELYTSLAIPKPGSWKSAFGNARTKGFVQNVGRGKWKPTIPGENFARYGTRGRSGGRQTQLEPSENGGGEDN